MNLRDTKGWMEMMEQLAASNPHRQNESPVTIHAAAHSRVLVIVNNHGGINLNTDVTTEPDRQGSMNEPGRNSSKE